MNTLLQALEFLSNHKDTVVILLKNEGSWVSLSLVDEIHLLVLLCANVLPLVPRTELVSILGVTNCVEVKLL
jgi:nuclear pore complex protein Nup205